jgi:hypothetical protein
LWLFPLELGASLLDVLLDLVVDLEDYVRQIDILLERGIEPEEADLEQLSQTLGLGSLHHHLSQQML